MKILDCTLRDGGYYTNWDFDTDLTNTYFNVFNQLPVDYLEIGYRSIPMSQYMGAYYYCPISMIEDIKKRSNKKIAVILNEKDIRPEHSEELLGPCQGLVSMIRLAIDPKNFTRGLKLAEEVKNLGFETGFNVMYMSKWKFQPDFLNQISEVGGLADYFYMVDSYGGVYPSDVKETFELIRSKTNVKIGFHGHNNMEMALINSITAIECGAEIIDATITGMGRGAGNLKTELILTAYNAKYNLDVNFNALSEIVDQFENLQKNYKWGTNLPYMVSGANSLPQKDVMEWVGKRYYSFNSIIRALHNQKEGKKDNQELEVFKPENQYKNALIVGGGPSVKQHKSAIKEFVNTFQGNLCLIHASSKNARFFDDLPGIEQFYCLAGNEGHRLEKVFEKGSFSGTCVLPPFPRKMGTYIPQAAVNNSYELEKSNFDYALNDTHTILAMQTALELKIENIYLIGYDGYPQESISSKEHELCIENQEIFNLAKQKFNIFSLAPTTYDINSKSIYTFLQ